jgi:phosphoribosylformimino-5-aminoimidazole carboxamide ribotide isomerase
MSFEIIPAIDLLDGTIVRLREGRYDRVTSYPGDPFDAARAFTDAGATRLHVVDLDGAREGSMKNAGAIERMASLPIALQVGGGVRTRETALRLYALGVRRVVLGTAAVEDPELVRALASEREVIVAVDGRGGRVATQGWTEATEIAVRDLARDADRIGAAAILYTSIERDGTGTGPDVGGTAELQRDVSVTVIASGGIGTLEHIRALRAAGVRACVCGRALHDGTFTLEEALAVAG